MTCWSGEHFLSLISNRRSNLKFEEARWFYTCSKYANVIVCMHAEDLFAYTRTCFSSLDASLTLQRALTLVTRVLYPEWCHQDQFLYMLTPQIHRTIVFHALIVRSMISNIKYQEWFRRRWQAFDIDTLMNGRDGGDGDSGVFLPCWSPLQYFFAGQIWPCKKNRLFIDMIATDLVDVLTSSSVPLTPCVYHTATNQRLRSLLGIPVRVPTTTTNKFGWRYQLLTPFLYQSHCYLISSQKDKSIRTLLIQLKWIVDRQNIPLQSLHAQALLQINHRNGKISPSQRRFYYVVTNNYQLESFEVLIRFRSLLLLNCPIVDSLLVSTDYFVTTFTNALPVKWPISGIYPTRMMTFQGLISQDQFSNNSSIEWRYLCEARYIPIIARDWWLLITNTESSSSSSDESYGDPYARLFLGSIFWISKHQQQWGYRTLPTQAESRLLISTVNLIIWKLLMRSNALTYDRLDLLRESGLPPFATSLPMSYPLEDIAKLYPPAEMQIHLAKFLAPILNKKLPPSEKLEMLKLEWHSYNQRRASTYLQLLPAPSSSTSSSSKSNKRGSKQASSTTTTATMNPPSKKPPICIVISDDDNDIEKGIEGKKPKRIASKN